MSVLKDLIQRGDTIICCFVYTTVVWGSLSNNSASAFAWPFWRCSCTLAVYFWSACSGTIVIFSTILTALVIRYRQGITIAWNRICATGDNVITFGWILGRARHDLPSPAQTPLQSTSPMHLTSQFKCGSRLASKLHALLSTQPGHVEELPWHTPQASNHNPPPHLTLQSTSDKHCVCSSIPHAQRCNCDCCRRW